MSRKKRFLQMFSLTLILLLLAGCGGVSAKPTATPTPSLLSDEEFAGSAREVCGTLKTEIASLDTLDLTSKAEAYRRAADALIDLEINQQSAPQGTRLRSGLAELADSLDIFDKALVEALIKARIEGPFTLMITEGGSVFVISGGDLSTLKGLEIEADISLELKAAQALVRQAATALGLEECAPEQQENGE